MQTQIKIYKLEATFRIKAKLQLPQFKGAIFHGTFGAAFRDTVCVTKAKNCDGCEIKNSCSYIYIFETEMPKNELSFLKNVAIAPHPYIINTSAELKTKYLEGEELSVQLIIIGNYMKILPFFIYAFKQMGKAGFGKERTKLELLTVFNVISKTDKKEIFNSSTNTVNTDVKPFNFVTQQNFPAELNLNFISPFRLQVKGEVIRDRNLVTAELLLKSILRRYNIVSHLFFNEKPVELELLSDGIEIKRNNLYFKQFHRYSAKQKQEMKFGGLLGNITIEVKNQLLLNIIIICKELNIGKNVSFGMGNYSLDIRYEI